MGVGENMQAKEFEKDTPPREILVYTCERIVEPLKELGFKYRKSKNDMIKKDNFFTYCIYFQPSKYGSTEFKVHISVLSNDLLKWREQNNSEIQNDCVFWSYLANLSKKDNDCPTYDVSSLISRENVIAEINNLIQEFALPFFDRFKDVKTLIEDVQQDGSFIPHRMRKWEIKQRESGIRRPIDDFIDCFFDDCNDI